MRLFCFSHAGSGASFFRHWGPELPEDLEVCAVQLPGRENRLREEPLRDVSAMVEHLVAALGPLLHQRPFAFFGHSLGALVAFELARRLQAQMHLLPVCLLVSGRNAPHWPRKSRASSWDDAALIAELGRLQGTDSGLLNNPEFLAGLLPVLRADYHAIHSYRHQPDERLACPVISFGGTQDPETSREGLEAWREQTTQEFELHLLPGNHFFIVPYRHLLLGMIANHLVGW